MDELNPFEAHEAAIQARYQRNHGTCLYAVTHYGERVSTVYARNADHACSMTARLKKLPSEYQLTALDVTKACALVRRL